MSDKTPEPCGCPLHTPESEAVERPPWRFDVPEVPAHVTAVKDVDDDVWLRTGDRWTFARGKYDAPGVDISYLITHAPLEECPDPRATT